MVLVVEGMRCAFPNNVVIVPSNTMSAAMICRSIATDTLDPASWM